MPYHQDMTSVPDRARVRLPGISSRAYEHPADRSALVALRKLTGFDVLLRRLASLFSDRSLRLLFLASSVKTSTEQFPHLHELLLDGSAILDLPEVPELFISQMPIPNAMALGSDKPFIVITTGMVDLMDGEEMRFVIGHELGHVLSGHAVYRTMLFHLTRLAARMAWFAIGYIGLRVIIAVVRFAELDRWVGDGDYEQILSGEYPRREDDPQASVSDEIRAAARSYQESWNRTSDPFVGLMKSAAETAADAGERLFGMFTGRRGGGSGGSGGSS
jgi:hypothetical protein